MQDRCHRLGQTKAVTVYRLVRFAALFLIVPAVVNLVCLESLGMFLVKQESAHPASSLHAGVLKRVCAN